MKKIHILLSAAALAICLLACTQEGDTYIIQQAQTEKTFPVKYATLTKKTVTLKPTSEQFEFCFMAGKEDIPYICLTADMFKKAIEKNIEVSNFDATTNKVTFTNKDQNNTKAELDLSKHTLRFENYDLFFQNHDKTYMDPADSTKFDYLKITEASNIAGVPVTLDWSTQDIDIVLWQDGTSLKLAVPVQFLNDIFLSPSQQYILYNGKDAYLSSSIAATPTFWTEGSQSGTRSAALAEFCYNELCLNLDFNYGLKAIHGIDKFPDFDTYFQYAGIKNELKSQDALTFANAIKDVCEFFFGDGHSNYGTNSHYLTQTASVPGTRSSPQTATSRENYIKYLNARGTPTTDASKRKPAYARYGKTAIVCFDSFSINNSNPPEQREAKIAHEQDFSRDGSKLLNQYVYFDAKDQEHESKYDTMALIHYVNKLIKTEGDNIENVVLDLSCNGGGALHSAAFVIAWMLGKCTLEFTNPITGAKWSETFLADVNCDGTYDEESSPASSNDSVKDKNLFCLVSPNSFSCGNMVPAMLKASDRVTILGVVSGGGTGCVQGSSAADGTTFRMSSKWVMSVSKNGSSYDIDKGVEPHYYINKPENFYNSETIDSLVTSINKAKLGN